MAEEQRRDFETEVMSYFDKARKKHTQYNKAYDLDYILKQKEYYENFYSTALNGKTSNEIDRELQYVKDSITEIIENEQTGNYHFSAMVQFIERLKILEAKRAQVFAAEEEVRFEQEKVQRNRNEVVETFGGFSERKRVDGKNGNFTMVPKTPAELTAERDERLAILEQMRKSRMISAEDFARKVVAVQQTYKPAIENSLLVEAQALAKKEAEDSKLINRVKSKIKNIFNFGEKVPCVDEADLQDPKKAYVQREAMSSLVEARRILGDGAEAMECFGEAMNIGQSIAVGNNPVVIGILGEFAQSKLDAIEAQYADDPAKETYIELQQASARSLGEVTCYSDVSDGSEVRDAEDLKREKFEVVGFMLDKFEHEDMQVIGPDGIVRTNYSFKNPDDEKVYLEVIGFYDKLESERQVVEGEAARLEQMAAESINALDM